jgi:hypothetical protein
MERLRKKPKEGYLPVKTTSKPKRNPKRRRKENATK